MSFIIYIHTILFSTLINHFRFIWDQLIHCDHFTRNRRVYFTYRLDWFNTTEWFYLFFLFFISLPRHTFFFLTSSCKCIANIRDFNINYLTQLFLSVICDTKCSYTILNRDPIMLLCKPFDYKMLLKSFLRKQLTGISTVSNPQIRSGQ